jgi:acyl carrier protein
LTSEGGSYLKKILEILEDIRPGADWASMNDIIESGLIDSFDMIALVNDLNESFGVCIGLEHLEPENFNSVEAIAALLRELGADI